MPTVNCGRGSSAALLKQGATIEIIVRSPMYGQEIKLEALIDTGSQLTIVESQFVQGWTLPIAGPGQFAGSSGRYSSDILMAEIEIPALNLRELTSITLRDDLGGRQAILGRTQLRECVLVYDGPQGTVQLRR
ncbi:MAG: hypothetical protein ABR989_16820 [Candidatus Binatus soli]